MVEVIGLVKKGENQNHSWIYAPGFGFAPESRAQDQTQTCITKTAKTKTENPTLRNGARVENLAFIQKAATLTFNAAINKFPVPTGSTRRSFDHVVRVKAMIVELYYGHFQDLHIYFGSVEDGYSGQEWKEGVKFPSHDPVVHHSGHDIKRRVESELNLRNFLVRNEIDGSGGVEESEWLSGLSPSSSSFSLVLSSRESLCCLGWIVMALIEL
nr:hypothetical protein [Tanacetum cinerariifolium]